MRAGFSIALVEMWLGLVRWRPGFGLAVPLSVYRSLSCVLQHVQVSCHFLSMLFHFISFSPPLVLEVFDSVLRCVQYKLAVCASMGAQDAGKSYNLFGSVGEHNGGSWRNDSDISKYQLDPHGKRPRWQLCAFQSWIRVQQSKAQTQMNKSISGAR